MNLSHSNQPSPRPLRLAIFGGTRGVGRALLQLALDAGHEVQVLVRDPARLDLTHPRLSVVHGEATDEAAVARTVQGTDAVMCALGAPALSRSRVRSEGMRHIVRAMENAQVRRVVCLSVLGIGDGRARLPAFLRYLVFPTYLRRPVAEHERQERILEESALEWTTVRPPTLTDGPRTGDYAHGFDDFEGLTLKVSRADVAELMLRLVQSQSYVRQSVGISDRAEVSRAA